MRENTCSSILASILHSTDMLSKEHNPDHVAALNECIDDVRLSSAEVLYGCVVSDLEQAEKEGKLRGTTNNEFWIAIVLATK